MVQVAEIMLTRVWRLDLQGWGCWNITNLSVVRENSSIILSTGCIDAIVQAMVKYPKSSYLQNQAITALSCLTYDRYIRYIHTEDIIHMNYDN